ncbi:MAG: hypothetical protein HY698_02060 [Deltaproteobacteria bacterium]|nr:hypothetical protein [Deltaproteobacteria bacterium]
MKAGLLVLLLLGARLAWAEDGAKKAATLVPAVVEVDSSVLFLDGTATTPIRARPATGHASGPARFLTQLGGTTSGIYSSQGRRSPGVAIVAAVVPLEGGGEARGHAVIILVGRGVLPTQTSKGAAVTVEIGNKQFGPVVADSQGKAQVPVEVPPGVATAMVHAVDHKGRRTTRELPLPKSGFATSLVIAPSTLLAGNSATISLFAIRPDGTPRDPAERLEARVGGAPLEVRQVKAVGGGRWDVHAWAPLGSQGNAHVTLASGEEVLGETTIVLEAPRLAPPPPPPILERRHPLLGMRPSLGIRAGLATAMGPAKSALLASHYMLPIKKGGGMLGLAFELTTLLGRAGEYRNKTVSATLFQLSAAAAVRLRFPFGERLAVDAGVGIGAVHAISWFEQAENRRRASATAPVLQAGAGVVLGRDQGEWLADVRYMDARLDPATRVEGNALGFVVTLGYRLRL